MELKHIELARLSVSGLNMRGTRKACDIANILPSVRARGVLVPLIVRELVGTSGGVSGQGEGGDHSPAYEILAGKRRYHAALTVTEEGAASRTCPARCWSRATMRRRSRPR